MWENKREGLASIKERLDRAIASNSWMEKFPEAKV